MSTTFSPRRSYVRSDDAVAERAYAPWVDLEALLRAQGLPLFSLETHRAAGAFDVVAFNLSAELVYTNLLNCLDLAGIPLRAEHRGDDRDRGRELEEGHVRVTPLGGV